MENRYFRDSGQPFYKAMPTPVMKESSFSVISGMPEVLKPPRLCISRMKVRRLLWTEADREASIFSAFGMRGVKSRTGRIVNTRLKTSSSVLKNREKKHFFTVLSMYQKQTVLLFQDP